MFTPNNIFNVINVEDYCIIVSIFSNLIYYYYLPHFLLLSEYPLTVKLHKRSSLLDKPYLVGSLISISNEVNNLN